MKFKLTDKQREILDRDAKLERAHKKEEGWSDYLYPIYGRHEHKSAKALENRDLARICYVAPHDHAFIRVRDEVGQAVRDTHWLKPVIVTIKGTN
jgi:metallophosphoesterase superfamily enzyme